MFELRKPKLSEVYELKQLLDAAATEGKVLPRALHIDMLYLVESRSQMMREDIYRHLCGKIHAQHGI